MQPARNGYRHFRAIIFKPYILAPASRLYHLKPAGVGTPDVESLTGYMSRLAGAHLLKLCHLITHIVGPLANKIQSPQATHSDTSWPYTVYSPHQLNGGAPRAETWVRALEELTLRRDLRSLTALPWGASVSQRGLLRQHKAWCPACYEHARQEGTVVYELLLWSFASVSACPLHKSLLEHACPHCERLLPILVGYSRPGYCSWCRRWLGGECGTSKWRGRGGTDYQITASQNVREWIGVGLCLSSPPSADAITCRLREYINFLTNGNAAAFGRLTNISEGKVFGWYSGTHPPAMADLLKISEALGTTPARFLTGWTFVEPALNPEEYLMRMRDGAWLKYLDKAEIGQALEAALTEDPPPTVREFASRFGYKSPQQLYSMFPDLCRTLTRRCRSAGRYRSRRPPFTEKDKRKMRRALEGGLNQTLTPSLEQIAIGLGLKGYYPLRRWFPELCCQVIAKRAEDKEKLQKDMWLRLKGVAEEWPPPRPAEVARRFGYKSFESLTISFPDLGRFISERYASWVKQLRSEPPKGLLDALDQYPPPSLSEVARPNGYNLKTLWNHYPEICLALTKRWKDYQRRLSHDKRQAYKEEVKRISIKLRSQGQYPSAKRIRPLLVNQPNLNYVFLTEVLRELRQENSS